MNGPQWTYLISLACTIVLVSHISPCSTNPLPSYKEEVYLLSLFSTSLHKKNTVVLLHLVTWLRFSFTKSDVLEEISCPE
jgi:hypothetical protein